VLGCIAFGTAYFAKVPVKKALQDTGNAEMTGAENFWYILGCIPLGANYMWKVRVKKALSEASTPALRQMPTELAHVAENSISPQSDTLMIASAEGVSFQEADAISMEIMDADIVESPLKTDSKD